MSDMEFTPTGLDEFAAWAHALNQTPGVEIISTADNPHEIQDPNAPHGSNTPEEMGGDDDGADDDEAS